MIKVVGIPNLDPIPGEAKAKLGWLLRKALLGRVK